MRVLLVEDDGMIARGLQTALRQGGFAVDWVAGMLSTGTPPSEALAALRALEHRLVDLRMLLGDLPGVLICHRAA